MIVPSFGRRWRAAGRWCLARRLAISLDSWLVGMFRNVVIPAKTGVVPHCFTRFVMALRTVSSASAAAESLSLASPRESNQREGDPDLALAMKPRVRVGREGFLTVHPCTGKNARASMRAPLTGLTSQPPPPQRGPQGLEQKQKSKKSKKQKRAAFRLAAVAVAVAVAVSSAFDLGPRHRAEQRSRARGKGAHVRAHGCASSRRPENGEQRRVRRSRAMLGSPFFWLLFFGDSKKSDSAAAEADETLRRAERRREKRWMDYCLRRNDNIHFKWTTHPAPGGRYPLTPPQTP